VLDPTMSEPQQVDPAGFAGDLDVDVDRRDPSLAVLSVRGEIDALTTPRLEAELDRLLADLPELLVVVGTRAVRRPLQITGSDQLFDLFDDLDSAVGGPV
jgi:anti-sigma B factor antagonist